MCLLASSKPIEQRKDKIGILHRQHNKIAQKRFKRKAGRHTDATGDRAKEREQVTETEIRRQHYGQSLCLSFQSEGRITLDIVP